MYWDVVDVYPLKDRELAVTFDEGVNGTIKICKSFCTGVFKPLLDDSVITKAKIKQGAIVWENGLDLAPDTLYKAIKLNPDKYYKIT